MTKTILSLAATSAVFAIANEGAATAKTATMILTDETKIANVVKALGGSRKLYDSVEQALAKLAEAAGATESLYGLTVAAKGIDSEGNADPEFWAEGSRAMLAIVQARVDVGSKKLNGLKGLVLLPVPTLEQFLESELGRQFVDKVTEKEIAHVSFRPFREANNEAEFIAALDVTPIGVDAFATESARSSGVDTETFDAVWTDLRAALKNQKPEVAKLLPTKNEVVKAIRSKAYAMENHEALETARVFEWLSKLILQAANQAKMSTAAIEAWVAGRDEFVFAARKAQEQDFSVLQSIDLFGGNDDESAE